MTNPTDPELLAALAPNRCHNCRTLAAAVRCLEDCRLALEERVRELEQEVERLRGQLPDGMKHCTIRFLECERGHGRLTADNWVPHECKACEIERLTQLVTMRG